MKRVAIIIAASSSFLIVPGLCTGAVITHVCDCVEDTCCLPGSDSHDRSGCGHESACPDDPCSIRVIRNEGRTNDAIVISLPATPTVIICIVVNPPSVQTDRATAHRWLGGKNLSFPTSDVPLLV